MNGPEELKPYPSEHPAQAAPPPACPGTGVDDHLARQRSRTGGETYVASFPLASPSNRHRSRTNNVHLCEGTLRAPRRRTAAAERTPESRSFACTGTSDNQRVGLQ